MISSSDAPAGEAGAPASESLISSEIADGEAAEGTTEGAADGKAAGDQGTPTGAPEAYATFDIAEGVQYSEAQLESAKGLFRDLELTQAKAQKLIDFQTEWAGRLGQSNAEATARALSTVQANWADQVRADPDLGGERLLESQRLVKAALVNVTGGTELEEVLTKFGLTNHPVFFRFLASVGKGMSSDGPGREGDGGAADDGSTDKYGLNKKTRAFYAEPTQAQ